MGARPFMVESDIPDLLTAFRQAVEEARWEHGHGGETGTIAEKDQVREVRPPRPMTDEEKVAWAWRLIEDEEDEPDLDWIQDKWEPAAAIRLDTGAWLFFGWAAD